MLIKSISKIVKVTIWSGLFFILGCTSLQETKNAKGSGDKVTFQSDFESVWLANIRALAEFSLTITEVNKKEGYVLAERKINVFTYGENIAVFITSKNKNETNVEIVAHNKYAWRQRADWAGDIFDKIAKHLNK